MALACAEGAYYNVLINLQGIEDEQYVNATRAEADKVMDETRELAEQMRAVIGKGLGI
jgi:formiminotetrahydrofolate cyclodeaminase